MQENQEEKVQDEGQAPQSVENEAQQSDSAATPKKDAKRSFWRKLLFSDTLEGKSLAKKCAYIGVCVALLAIVNTLEGKIPSGVIQISLTTYFSLLAGIIVGPAFGFTAGFLGDLVGFLANSGGNAYYPFIGLAMGLTAFIGGVVFGVMPLPLKGLASIFVRATIAAVLTFAICSVAINTTAFWVIYNGCKVPYWTYFVSRYILKGQLWVSLGNYALLFITLPALVKIKPLNIKIL